MPSITRKSPSRLRSKSPGRRSTSRSRSRGRTRSRGRSPSRKAKQSPPPKEKSEKTTPKRESRPRTKTPSTPTRQSARVAALAIAQEEKTTKENHESTTTETKQVSVREQKKVAEQSSVPAPPKQFGANIGALIMILCSPVFVILLNLVCGKECVISKLPVIPRSSSAYFNLKAAGIYLGWVAFQFLVARLPVGRLVEGQPLKNGKRLKYRCNGFLSLLVSLLGFGALVYMDYPVHKVYALCVPMIVTAIILSLCISLALYVRGQKLPAEQKALTGNTGNLVYDFFMGQELNPRLFGVDLKFWLQLRPGLIGWVLLNCVFIMEAVQQGNGGSPNPALLLVVGFQAWYVAESLWFEDAVLTTMNIAYEGVGFLLVFGDMVWAPFLYSLQGKFLLQHPQQWSTYSLVAFAFLNLVGYIIFRGSNMQKHRFRTNPYDPSLTHLDTLATSSGKRLLVSGWWGLCRHPNYLGDLIMALAWTLPCGFSHALPWFYPVYFLFLLVGRAQRDDAQCRRKYGSAWDRYCQRVPHRIVPYIY